jgi:hypothetical protein
LDRLILIVGDISSRFLDLVLIVVIVENPASHKYVVENGINFFKASSVNAGYSD